MESSNSFTTKSPVFSGKNYVVWAVKMKAYLKAFDLWEDIETECVLPPLPVNATLNQMRRHSEESAKRYESLTCIHSSVMDEIFSRIMTCETAKQAWDRIKQEFQGDQKAIQMQILSWRREYEMQKMSKTETVKEYADRVLKIVNQIRLNGEELSDRSVVQKVLVSLPEKFKPKISSLEDSRDLTQISLSKLCNALQAVSLRLESKPVEAQAQLAENDEQQEKQLFVASKIECCHVVKSGSSPCSHSKACRFFNVKTQKIEVSRSVKFDEKAIWDWEKQEVIDGIDDPPVRVTRTPDDVYSRCNLAVLKLCDYQDAENSVARRKAIQEGINMIVKNGTWELVDSPQNMSVIGVCCLFSKEEC
ncbi:hypothetical protein SLEP1_g36718 [Rubroshorea leprosula]|uniref:Retroviral polymerase SH3-like domain-containing protein n=1 Tax=Rubroshorea leprosula TaxID=152421 RepID=A0AAV5KSM0_9ROSI|nr:hypothetical protein SLEP1_g36718 [Rubroshorea leprosula]